MKRERFDDDDGVLYTSNTTTTTITIGGNVIRLPHTFRLGIISIIEG